MPNNDTLIRVWAAIRSIAEMLCRCETWPRFVPDKGYAEKADECGGSWTKRQQVKTLKRRNRDRPRQRLDA